MSKTYYCFSFSGAMNLGQAITSSRPVSAEDAIAIIKSGVEAGYNPAHISTMKAMKQRYGIEVPPPPSAPKIVLAPGDRVLTLEIQGLPRETREFTDTEVAKATFRFVLYEVAPVGAAVFTVSMMEEVWRLMGLGCPVSDELSDAMRARFAK